MNPLFVSLNKKLNLPVKENNVVETTETNIFDEIIGLTCQFQQLLDKYFNSIMDFETLDYYKAKKDIERINKLLTSGFSTVNIEGKVTSS